MTFNPALWLHFLIQVNVAVNVALDSEIEFNFIFAINLVHDSGE